HVEKRHVEFYERVYRDMRLVNTYVVDPAHIAPSRSDANSNGHFPLNNHVPTGTPRGFQLPSQFPMGFPLGAGVPSPLTPGVWGPGNLPPGMAAAWGPPGSAAGHVGFGPMRTTGGRNNYTGLNGFGNGGARVMGAPYQRNDPRGQRGMPMMPGARPMGMPGMPGFGMGMEGGALAMGPKEAVQGRQLRSYEDLDADAGNGKATGELDY
ncbi:hypothetical protein LTR33_016921, partial [Friedmanniomyces endolithicus]